MMVLSATLSIVDEGGDVGDEGDEGLLSRAFFLLDGAISNNFIGKHNCGVALSHCTGVLCVHMLNKVGELRNCSEIHRRREGGGGEGPSLPAD